NVDDRKHQSTYCPSCRELLIERNWYELGRYDIQDHRCAHCGEPVSGRFDSVPGSWGRRRLPVNISRYAPTTSAASEAALAPGRQSKAPSVMTIEPSTVVPLTAPARADA